jgi:hypothetical protein
LDLRASLAILARKAPREFKELLVPPVLKVPPVLPDLVDQLDLQARKEALALLGQLDPKARKEAQESQGTQVHKAPRAHLVVLQGLQELLVHKEIRASPARPVQKDRPGFKGLPGFKGSKDLRDLQAPSD